MNLPSRMRFLHVADVHLDTLFASRSASLRTLLRNASREALRRMVHVALDRRVDAVLISGDLFDGERLSFETEHFLLEEMKRLEAGGVPVIYATGNHDPGRGPARAGSFAWPANVTVVRDGTPVHVQVRDSRGVPVGTVTAAGHESSMVGEDLSRAFPPPDGPLPSVALLHTQVSDARASSGHARYAPSELSRLRAFGYDYWALGHVHLRQALSEVPAIHYPGNLHGRNPRESGPKGCLLVDLSAGQAPRIEFLDLAPIRWETIRVRDLAGASQFHPLVRRIAEAWEADRAADPGTAGTQWIVRVELSGPCPLWRELSREDDRATLEDRLQDVIDALRIEVRAEEVHPVVSTRESAERQDVLGEALRLLGRAEELARAGPSPAAAASGISAAELLGIHEGALGGFDRARHPTLDHYLGELLRGQEPELLARLLGSGPPSYSSDFSDSARSADSRRSPGSSGSPGSSSFPGSPAPSASPARSAPLRDPGGDA